METPPNRFGPDNSQRARNQRMAYCATHGLGIATRLYVLPKVTEIPHKVVLPEPEGVEDNVIYLPVKTIPPDMVA